MLRLLFALVVLPQLFSVAVLGQQQDIVRGNIIQFNNNGAYCWYQDERAVIDTVGMKLLVGSDASAAGFGGSPRDGDVEAAMYDLRTGAVQRFTLKESSSEPAAFYTDDHNAPAFLVLPNGQYMAMYAAHFNDTSSYRRFYNNGSWGAELRFNWVTAVPGGDDFQTTYSNLFYLSNENRIYNVVRGYQKSPNSMVSTDLGATWKYGGLITKPDSSIGYVNGYFKYWSNGVDRIDFIGTEHHPRDYNTSIYHGYIQGGKSYITDGTLLDTNIFDTDAPTAAKFTKIFAANTVVNGMKMTRCWDCDVVRYKDSTIAAIITARINDTDPAGSNPDHAFFYVRYDGTTWKYTYLGRAGLKLFSSEEDYTGLGALQPDDPNTIYLSSTYDPRSDSSLSKHEIFKGTTTDHGATWSWIPITWNSTRDNLRPIVPKWDSLHSALIWWRGTYTNAQTFDAAVVGIIDSAANTHPTMEYVDADLTNTMLASGSKFAPTGPSSSAGASDANWHQRTGFGNGNSVFTSSESGNGEDAPLLKTRVPVTKSGLVDVWINFWANPAEDWRIQAGLSSTGMQVYRSMTQKQVDSTSHTKSIVITGSSSTHLYQAYLGRTSVPASGTYFDVYVDDYAIKTGTASTMAGGTTRTWYDGVSYSFAGETQPNAIRDPSLQPKEFALQQNYPNPFNPATNIHFTIPELNKVSLKIYNVIGEEVAVLADNEMAAGSYTYSWNAKNVPSGIYFCRLTTGKYSSVMKMLLLK